MDTKEITPTHITTKVIWASPYVFKPGTKCFLDGWRLYILSGGKKLTWVNVNYNRKNIKPITDSKPSGP